MMLRIVVILTKIFLLISFVVIYSQAQTDKCTNSTHRFLCDPGFENSARRDMQAVNPYACSQGIQPFYNEVNRCLGGPLRGIFDWDRSDYWDYYGPPYMSSLPLHGLPNFISWFQATSAHPDYFNRNAHDWSGTYFLDLSADVPFNYASYQEPAEGEQGNGYIGIASLLYYNRTASPEDRDAPFREYVEVKLKEPLLVNHSYLVSFKVSHGIPSKTWEYYQSIKKICAYFSKDEFPRSSPFEMKTYSWLVLPDGESPQICYNDQNTNLPETDFNYMRLEDSVNWMKVEQAFTVKDYNRNYMIIGNFQDNQDFKRDLTLVDKKDHPEKLMQGAYYFIDSVNIIEYECTPDSCLCDLHDMKIEPLSNTSNDTACCYTIKIKSDSLTCDYNKIIMKNINTSEIVEFTNNGNYFPRLGSYFTLSSNYCFKRPDDGNEIRLHFELINTNRSTDTLTCFLRETIKCNCSCYDMSLYGYGTPPRSISVSAVRQEGTCCYDLFIDNNSDCQLPFNILKMHYKGSNINDLSFSSFSTGWSYSMVNNLVTFTKSNPSIIFASQDKQKICTICVNEDGYGEDQKLVFSLGKFVGSEYDSCDITWNGDLKCGHKVLDCCQNLKCELLPTHPAVGSSNDSLVFLESACCWALKVSELQKLECKKIKKMEVFSASNPLIPIRVYNNPEFNNQVGKIFYPVFCIDAPAPAQGYSNHYLPLRIKFTDFDDSVCVQEIVDSCIVHNYHTENKAPDANLQDNSCVRIELDNISVIPNPFSSDPIIEYMVSSDSKASLEVFNSIGELVKVIVSGSVKPGSYSAKFDTNGLSDGIYYIKFTNGDKLIIKPVIKIK